MPFGNFWRIRAGSVVCLLTLRFDSDALHPVRHHRAPLLQFRLLFVLYAESRESEMYRDAYSLHATKHEVARGRALLPNAFKDRNFTRKRKREGR